MSLLSRLFGGGSGGPKSEAETVSYKDFDIQPCPVQEGGRHRVGALIRKDVGGEMKVHHLIRADALESHDVAVDVSVSKAKQMIDEQGEGIFR